MYAWLNKRQDDKQEGLNYEKKLKKDEEIFCTSQAQMKKKKKLKNFVNGSRKNEKEKGLILFTKKIFVSSLFQGSFGSVCGDFAANIKKPVSCEFFHHRQHE